MKLIVFGESQADEAAIRVLVEGLLGRETAPQPLPPLRSRGYHGLRQALPTVIKHAHYRTEADGLIVVVDSNGTRLHEPGHDEPGADRQDCRLCELRAVVNEVLRGLRRRQSGEELKIAIALATPAIEAWYLCGVQPNPTETAWGRELERGAHARSEILKLKRAAYGTERPALPLETERAVEQARRLAADLTLLERAFPNGFGPLAREIRTCSTRRRGPSWKTPLQALPAGRYSTGCSEGGAAGVAQLVEHDVANVVVVGSNPIARCGDWGKGSDARAGYWQPRHGIEGFGDKTDNHTPPQGTGQSGARRWLRLGRHERGPSPACRSGLRRSRLAGRWVMGFVILGCKALNGLTQVGRTRPKGA